MLLNPAAVDEINLLKESQGRSRRGTLIAFFMFLMTMWNKRGPVWDPCGTPDDAEKAGDVERRIPASKMLETIVASCQRFQALPVQTHPWLILSNALLKLLT